MTMPMLNPSTLDGTETVQMPNPDDDLSICQFVLKYQLQFTKHFGPKYAYGVVNVHVHYSNRDDHEKLVAIARVRPTYQSTKGKTTEFDIPYGKFKLWRANVKLFDFISAK